MRCLRFDWSAPLGKALRTLSMVGILSLGAVTAYSATAEPRARPSANELYLSLAEGSFAVADIAGAERALEQVLRTDTTHFRARILAARIGLTKNDAALAESLLEAAAQRESLSRAQQNALNQLESELTDYRKTFQSGVETNAKSEARFAESEARRAREAKAAAEILDAVLPKVPETHPMTREVTMTRVRLQIQAGLYEAAANSLKQRLATDPGDYEALVFLSSLHLDNERWDELNLLVTPLKSNPDLADIALYIEGRLAYQQGRIGLARSKFEAALQAQNADTGQLRPSILFYRGLTLHQLGRWTEASEMLGRAIEAGFRADTAEERRFVGRVALLNRAYPSAIFHLERALTQLSEETARNETTLWLARAYYSAGLNPPALAALNTIIEATENPRSEWLMLRGSVYRRMGDLAAAREDFHFAFTLGEANPASHFTAGLADFEAGAVDLACTHFTTASRDLTENLTLQYMTALSQYLTGDYAAAAGTIRPLPTNGPLGRDLALLLYFAEAQRGQQAIEATLENLAAHPEARSGDRYALISRVLGGELSPERALFLAAGDRGAGERISSIRSDLSFWFAQAAYLRSDTEAFENWLKRTIDQGHPGLAAFQSARWQLAQNRHIAVE